MNKSYSINVKCQVRSLKQALMLIAICPFLVLLNTVFPIGILFGRPESKTIPLDQYWQSLAAFLVVMIVLSLPAFLLHRVYYVKNRNLTFEINSNKITVKEKDQIWIYSIADIVNAEKVLGIFYKNKIDNRGRLFSTWSDYGYIKVEFSDGKIFHFTSLMLNPETFDGFPTKIRYVFIPFLNRKSVAEMLEEKEQVLQGEKVLSEDKIEEFRQRFYNYSDEELVEKVKNSERYCKEALVAVHRIQEERKRTVEIG